MKIDLIEIANKIFKDKELIIEEISEDKVKISYVNRTPNGKIRASQQDHLLFQ